MKKLLLFLLILSVGQVSVAQITTFRKDYAISLFDLPANSVEALTPENYIIAGTNINLPITSSISQVNSIGDVLWSKRYASSFAYQITDIKRDDVANGYYVCGGNETGAAVFMTVDQNGDPVISKTFNISNADGVYFNNVNKTSDGGYILAGYVTGHNPDGAGPELYFAPITYTDNDGNSQTDRIYSPIVVKLDASGNHEWHQVTRYYLNAGLAPSDAIYNSASFSEVQEVSDGYIAVGQYDVNQHRSNQNADGDDATANDAVILKTDLNGNIVYHRQIDAPNTDPTQTTKRFISIRPSASGEPILTGYHGAGRRIIGLRLPSSGGWTGTTWSRRLGTETTTTITIGGFPITSTSNDEIESRIFELSDGNYGILGQRIVPLSFDFSSALLKFNPNTNNFLFAKKFQGSFFASFFPVGEEVSDGGYISLSLSGTATGWNFNLTKADENGELNSDCPDENIDPTSAGYSPTYAEPNYNSWSNSPVQDPTVLPTVTNISPTETLQCLQTACTPPDEATNVTATLNPICAGQSTSIDASGPGSNVSYNVYDAASGGTNLGGVPLTVSPTTTTTYYVETVSDSDPSCVSVTRVPVEVTVNPAPVADPSSNSPLCEGDNLNLTATTVTGGTYDWQGPNGYSSTDQNPIISNVTTADEGTYTLTVTANGCPSAPVSITVNISEAPTSNPSAIETTICEGEDIELTANTVSGATYDWQGPNGFTSSDQNPVIPSATNAASGIYTLQISIGSCNSSTEEVTINVEEAPTATADNDGPICEGNEVNISAIGTGTYEWEGPNGYTSTDQNNSISNITTAEAGIYTVIVTNAAGCKDTAETIIAIGQGPDLSISVTDISCFGLDDGTATVTATGTSPFSYNWTPIGGNNSTASDLTQGTYEVEVTDGDGCTSSESILINEPDEISLTLSSTESDCTDDTGTATVVASGGTGGLNYEWNDLASQTTATATDIGAGVYEVEVTDAEGCSVIGIVTVNSLNGPSLNIIDIQHVTCFGGADGSASAEATGGTPGYTFAWTPSGGSDATASDLGAGTYQVTVTDDAGCTAIEEVEITEPDELVLDGTSQDAFCGNFDGQIDLTVNGGTGVYTYNWAQDELSGNSNSDLGPGDYSVVVVDENGCEVNGNFTVGIVGNIPIDVVPDVVTIDAGETVDLDVIVGGGVINETYSWTPSDGLSCTDCPNPIASPDQTTTYVVTVTTDDGCVSSDSSIVVVEQPCTELFVPTIFSPNNDGKNDLLCTYGSCVASIQFNIYNRWGELVFSTQDQSECWDGTYKGKELNTATFAYKLKVTLTNGQEVEDAGNINLVR